MFALPARVRTAAVRSSQHIKSVAERTSRRIASTLVEKLVAPGIDATLFVTAFTSAVAAALNPGAACAIAVAIASIWLATNSRSRCAAGSRLGVQDLEFKVGAKATLAPYHINSASDL